MAQEKEAFLSRWSRLKREAPETDKALEERKTTQAQPAPVLPPVESLTPQSEFAGFMHPKVKEELRRVALKKLFTDPHFNIPDPFEAYSGDFTGGEPIPPQMLATLNQARTVLFTEEEKKAADERDAAAKAAETEVAQGEPKLDEPGRQDT